MWILLLTCIAGKSCLCSRIPGVAADNSFPDKLSEKELDDSQNSSQKSSEGGQAEAHSDQKATDNVQGHRKQKKDQSGAIVIAPLPIVSPALGAGVIPVVGYITPIPAKDKALTPSVIGAGGLITNNGTRGFGLASDLYLKQARYELQTMYAHGNLNYNLYGVGFGNGNAGLKLPLEQSGQVLFLKLLRNVGWDTYVGARFINGSSFITLRLASGKLPPLPPDVGLHTDLRALGMEAWRDSRPNRFYPLKGSVIDFTGDFFAHDLGSKYSFQSYRFTFNKYMSVAKQQVLAYNLNLCGTGGSPPFYGNCIYGAGDELRGYTAGRYLDRYMVATQLEYRLVLPWSFGLVGFGGIGGVAPGADQFRTNHLLPGAGTGIRYMLSKKYHVNLRTDFAWGKDNFTWSMGIGEAF